jgi:hypothetical protein
MIHLKAAFSSAGIENKLQKLFFLIEDVQKWFSFLNIFNALLCSNCKAATFAERESSFAVLNAF